MCNLHRTVLCRLKQCSPYPPYSITFCASCQEIFPIHPLPFPRNQQDAQISF
ncbi:hypothetical protein RUMCAL_03472 [Ruminococcus callidus ATCC 27760]|uniref:Uncharacterized protein n=1 Tax=Ruminococcus callidus ATCC 27760 TaxID=411473 RepID=U2LHX6_9FIRM|nr:hypothetical protein RUMCAL_03472 [Ruminococcus callidus ATCC 27760]